MAVNPADSAVFGTLYGSDAMRAIFDDAAFFRRMLDVEAALARVQARLGLIPAAAADAISAAVPATVLDPAELAASVRNVGYPVIAVVKALSRAAGPEARRCRAGVGDGIALRRRKEMQERKHHRTANTCGQRSRHPQPQT